ncbi:MAG: thioesterase [Micrococcales bacterium]|nr:thioesterase [Micrococcales bacterium]
MKLWLRLIWAQLSWRFRGKLSVADTGYREFVVWPTDIDLFMHMNNGVFLTLLDLARLDLMKRAHAWQELKRAKVHPVVVAETITFRKSLTPWLKFGVETKILGWDETAFFIGQRFVVGNEIYAEAVVKLRFLKSPKGTPTPAEVNLLLGGWPKDEPKLPDWVIAWNQAAALPKGKEPAPSNWRD